MPGKVERANVQRPHAEYEIYAPRATLARSHRRNIYTHIHKASTVCYNLDFTNEIYQISERQERAQNRRFSLCSVNPTRITRRRASAVLSTLQRYYYFPICTKSGEIRRIAWGARRGSRTRCVLGEGGFGLPRPDRRGYYRNRVRCTLVISRTHENWDEAENLGIAEYSDS